MTDKFLRDVEECSDRQRARAAATTMKAEFDFVVRESSKELDIRRARIEALTREAARLREALDGRRFPIQDGAAIPWSAIAPFEGQVKRNHGQDLEKLASRGGLSTKEAIHVLECVDWNKSPRSALIMAMYTRDAALHLAQLVDAARAALSAPASPDASDGQAGAGCLEEGHVCGPKCLEAAE